MPKWVAPRWPKSLVRQRARRLVVSLVVWAAGAFAAVAAAGDAGIPRVLFLFANDHRISATITLSEAARARLAERLGEVLVYSDFLDLQRFPGEADQARVARFLTEKYAGVEVDAVIAFGPQALRFIAEQWSEGVPSRRVLFSAVGAETAAEVGTEVGARIEVAGTTNAFDYTRVIDLALGLQPGARQVVAIFGSSGFDQGQEQALRAQLAPYADRIELETWSGLRLDEVLERVARLPRDAILLPGSFRAQPSGEAVNPNDVARLIVTAAGAPTYSVYDGQLGHGLVGAYGGSFADDGWAVGDLLADMLEGRDLGPPPVRREIPRSFRVDARQLDRWGLPRSALPEGTELLFEPPSIWEEHRALVLAVLGVISVQSGLVVALLVQRRRRRAEEEAALQRQEVAHLTRVSSLGELSGAIAHEINQPLAAILTNAHAALDMLGGSADAAELRETIEDIIADDNRAAEVIARLRGLLRKAPMSVEPVEVNGIVQATAKLLASELASRRIAFRVELADGLPAVSGDPVQIQQVLINLVMNAMDATAAAPPERRVITLATAAAGGSVEVTVGDGGPGVEADGRAFEPFYTTKAHGLGLGLTVCRSIVEAHGGTLSLENDAVHGGAVARFRLPARADLAAAE